MSFQLYDFLSKKEKETLGFFDTKISKFHYKLQQRTCVSELGSKWYLHDDSRIPQLIQDSINHYRYFPSWRMTVDKLIAEYHYRITENIVTAYRCTRCGITYWNMLFLRWKHNRFSSQSISTWTCSCDVWRIIRNFEYGLFRYNGLLHTIPTKYFYSSGLNHPTAFKPPVHWLDQTDD